MRQFTRVERARMRRIGNALLARLTLDQIDHWKRTDPHLGDAAALMLFARETDDDDLAVAAGDILRDGLPAGVMVGT